MNEIFSPPSTDAGSQTQRPPRGRVSRTPAWVAFDPSSGATINVGCVLKDRYLIESRLGEAVFKATDRFQRDAAKRCVAIKVVQENGASGSARLGRLRRGFHRAQSLCHETIVKVYELDQIGECRAKKRLTRSGLFSEIVCFVQHRRSEVYFTVHLQSTPRLGGQFDTLPLCERMEVKEHHVRNAD